MLRIETVEAGTLALIHQLMEGSHLRDFNLVGGTALSLQIGHRMSVDIDLFSAKDFDAPGLALHLERKYKPEDMRVIKNGIFSVINKVKIDMIAHQFPYIKPPFAEDGIRMLSLEDLGAMKLNAIVKRGTRLKDFVDMYVLLEHRPLKEYTTAFVSKYPDVNEFMAHTALMYHDDIVHVPIVLLREKVTLKEMKERFNAAVLEPHKMFLSVSDKHKKIIKPDDNKPAQSPDQHHHKGRRK